jgi:hypothetical protein
MTARVEQLLRVKLAARLQGQPMLLRVAMLATDADSAIRLEAARIVSVGLAGKGFPLTSPLLKPQNQ